MMSIYKAFILEGADSIVPFSLGKTKLRVAINAVDDQFGMIAFPKNEEGNKTAIMFHDRHEDAPNLTFEFAEALIKEKEGEQINIPAGGERIRGKNFGTITII
ncbi:MAG: hypothetical protein K9G62_01615 [Alphaproteobacteria bacterium]|nr:hypothetical protein [Alphaproteobacteria bacterium]